MIQLPPVLQALIARGANIEARDRISGQTSLIIGAQRGHLPVVEVTSYKLLFYPTLSISGFLVLADMEVLFWNP